MIVEQVYSNQFKYLLSDNTNIQIVTETSYNYSLVVIVLPWVKKVCEVLWINRKKNHLRDNKTSKVNKEDSD